MPHRPLKSPAAEYAGFVEHPRYGKGPRFTGLDAADTLEWVQCGLLLVDSAVFSAKLLPRLRGLLKPLLLDANEPHYTRARKLLSEIEGVAAR